jgi:hypothetical protein
MQQHPAVGGLFDPPPLDMQLVVGVVRFCPHVTIGLSLAMDYTISDGPYILDVHVFLGHEKLPSGKVFAVPESNSLL